MSGWPWSLFPQILPPKDLENLENSFPPPAASCAQNRNSRARILVKIRPQGQPRPQMTTRQLLLEGLIPIMGHSGKERGIEIQTPGFSLSARP